MRPLRSSPPRPPMRDKLSPTLRPLSLVTLLADRHAGDHELTVSAVDEKIADDDVLDIGGCGRMLRIGRNKLYEMVARNEIPHRRFGRRIRFSRAAIILWLNSWSLQGAKERQ